MKTKLLSLFTLFFTASLAFGQPTDEAAIAKELQAYYKTGTAPAYADAIKNLTAEKPEQRAGAAKYLIALLDIAQKDEISGKAPWHASPYWGSSGENPARNLRQYIADELAKAPASPATLAVIRWYLDYEKDTRFQATVVGALDKVQGKEADQFRLSLLEPVHENSIVVQGVLRQIGDRKTALPDAVLKALCNHYRPSLRDAARQLNKERGGADPGPFNEGKAMLGPAIAKLMTDIGALLDQPAPADADFVVVTTKTTGKWASTHATLGWLVKNDGDSWVVLTRFGPT